MANYSYQYFHEEKLSRKSNDEVCVDVNDCAAVRSLVHVTDVADVDLKENQNLMYVIFQAPHNNDFKQFVSRSAFLNPNCTATRFFL